MAAKRTFCLPLITISLVVSLITPVALQAQPKILDAQQRAFWGDSKANCSQGDRLFIGAGGAVLFGRMVAPDSVRLLNEYYLPSTVQGLVVRENILYVLDLMSGLHVFDVSDITRPRETATLPLDQRSYGIVLASNALFVTHDQYGVSKIDISDPLHPALVLTAAKPSYRLWPYANYLFWDTGESITIADQTSLDSVSSIPYVSGLIPGAGVIGLNFTGTQMLLLWSYFDDAGGRSYSRLTVSDVTTAASPVALGSVELPPSGRTLARRGDTAFIFTGDTVCVVNVHDPYKPALLSKTPRIGADLVTVADSLLLASEDYRASFKIIDVRDPARPVMSYTLSTLSDISSVYVTDSLLIAGRENSGGILLTDLRESSRPRKQHVLYDTVGSIRGLTMSGGHLFAAATRGLKIFDLAGRDSLSLIGQLYFGVWTGQVDVQDTLVAATGLYNDVHLLSVSDPGNPRYLVRIGLPQSMVAEKVALSDTLLFVCGDYGGLVIYSIRDVSHPLLLSQQYFYTSEGMFLRGRTLFVAEGAILRAFDVSNPANPAELGSYNCFRRILDVAVSDSLAFVAVFSNGYSEDNGLLVLDARRLTQMKEIARANTPGWSKALFVTDSQVYLSDNRDGAYIYDRSQLLIAGLSGSSGGSPDRTELFQNYPNPFNPSTAIRFALPHRSHVTLTVFNTLGQKVMDLVNGEMDAGEHSVLFNASDLASGVYFYRLQAGSFTQTRALCILR